MQRQFRNSTKSIQGNWFRRWSVFLRVRHDVVVSLAPILTAVMLSVLVASPVQSFEQSLPSHSDSSDDPFEESDATGDVADESVSEEVFHSFMPRAAAKIKPSFASAEEDLEAYREGSQAYEAGKYGTALKKWEPLAKKGDLFALWQLANMYRLGNGVKRDHKKAFGYYQKVASQHRSVGRYTGRTRITVGALVQLARYYERGLKKAGVRRNIRKAIEIYKLTGSHFGHKGAQFSLGKIYLRGPNGVRKSVHRGLRWLNLSAEKYHARAQAMLGEVYWRGRGVRANRVRGLMWYMLAQEYANPQNEQSIIERFHVLYGATDDEERQQAQAMVNQWHARISEKGKWQ